MHRPAECSPWTRASRLIAGAHFDRSGTIAIKFGLLLPMLLFMVGNSFDHARYMSAKNKLQAAADAAALGAARELSLTDTKYENLQAVAQSMVAAYVDAGASGAGAARTMSAASPQVSTAVSGDPVEVEVIAKVAFAPVFGDMFGMGLSEVSARAVARVVGRPNICLLALANYGVGGAIWLSQSARMTGQNCSVFSNSTMPGGIVVRESAVLSAYAICSAGGYEGGQGNYNPAPLADCPTFDDPLSGRAEPAVGSCVADKLDIEDQTIALKPGTYCGGLAIRGNAKVTFEPGVYVMKDGPLLVTDKAEIIGTDVGFFFKGAGARVDFDVDTSITLSAQTKGEMAGLLFFGARDQSVFTLNRIRSNNARVLIGTLYFPKTSLQIDADQPVGDQSAYTAIVADRVILMAGPHLVLNTNYDQTDVPVPDGIRGAGQPVALAR